MECPHCGYLLTLPSCSHCGGEIPLDSRYCCWCGHPLPTEKEEEFSERRLCSDGTCIGVINERGVCNICGKPFTGEPI